MTLLSTSLYTPIGRAILLVSFYLTMSTSFIRIPNLNPLKFAVKKRVQISSNESFARKSKKTSCISWNLLPKYQSSSKVCSRYSESEPWSHNDDELYTSFYQRLEELGMESDVEGEWSAKEEEMKSYNPQGIDESNLSTKGPVPFQYYKDFYESRNITQTSLSWQQLEAERAAIRSKSDVSKEPKEDRQRTEQRPEQVDPENVLSMREQYFMRFKKIKESLNQNSAEVSSDAAQEDPVTKDDQILPIPQPIFFEEENLQAQEKTSQQLDITDEQTWANLIGAAEGKQKTNLQQISSLGTPEYVNSALIQPIDLSIVETNSKEHQVPKESLPEEKVPDFDFLKRKYYDTVWLARNVKKLRPDQLAVVAPPQEAKEEDPDQGFQLPLVAKFSDETISRLHEAERKHSRAAMLGLGSLCGLISQGFFAYEDLVTLFSFWQVDAIICFAVLYELKYLIGNRQAFENSIEHSVREWLDKKAIQNKKHHICSATFLDQLKLSEIKHGRMAMIAITAFFIEASWPQAASADFLKDLF
mmetsp:Transcript_33279/g.43887  ORF Transcript_33279/g.43887 Transcript_33279/m.43887 type:complete len:530 (+) Transcript_33279:274-1863(+)